jgi:hypothetical protein
MSLPGEAEIGGEKSGKLAATKGLMRCATAGRESDRRSNKTKEIIKHKEPELA